MQRALLIKLLVIGLVAIVLWIPLGMISGKISERSRFQDAARSSIAQSWTGSQEVIGPIVVMPYTIEWETEKWDEQTKSKIVKIHQASRESFILPDQIKINSTIATDIRYKGIYRVPVYTSNLTVNGVLDSGSLKTSLDRIKNNHHFLKFNKPYLSVAVTDPRGINSIPKLRWNEMNLSFKPGSLLKMNENGLHASLPAFDPVVNKPIIFNFEVELRGMESMQFVPAASETLVSITSPWPHPQFLGSFLPVSRSISPEGFNAEWKMTSFATNIEQKALACEKGDCKNLWGSGFGVKLIEPVNVYVQSERSVKYGILFIGLIFVTFFLFEVLKKLRIHPVQYTLVGFAISIFYLLLISLSEHVSFAVSYLAASVGCVVLLFVYLIFVLKSAMQSALFSLVMFVLYGVLYIIIRAEDFALLMGSVLTFAVLGIVMLSTRKINWYDVGEQISDMNLSRQNAVSE